MPYISVRHLTSTSGQHHFKLDKKQGSQQKQDDFLKTLARQRGLHSGNPGKHLLAKAIVHVATTMVVMGESYATTAGSADKRRLENNIEMAGVRSHQNNVASAVRNEIARQNAGERVAKPEHRSAFAIPADRALALNTSVSSLSRMVRSVPLRSMPQATTMTTPIPRDDVKKVELPRFVIKKIDSLNDALVSITKGGAHPFQSLMDIGSDIYSIISYKDVSHDTRKLLIQIGSVIDDIAALIPDVNFTRFPFKLTELMTKPDTPPTAEELTGLLNDVHALKSYFSQEVFPTTQAKLQKGAKTGTLTVTDRNGKSHTLPVSWYKKTNRDTQLPDGGEWKIPLRGYRASKKEMLIERDNGLYSSMDNHDFIKIKKDFYPVEFLKGQPDNAFIINSDEQATIPVERVAGSSTEWRVVFGMRSSKNKPDTTDIQWEHRLASAASSHTLELAQPDMTTGIATIEGEQYIRGNYGVYKIEYNDSIKSYVVKTGDGLDYPVSYNKNTFTWETKIVNFKSHRLTSNRFKRFDNHLKESVIKQELKRRSRSDRLRYPVQAGDMIKFQRIDYIFEADGFTELRSVNYDKYVKVMRGIKGAEQEIKFALEAIAKPHNSQVRKVISEHFAISESSITPKLINEVKNNLMALQSGILWLRRSEYSIMTLNNLPGVRGRYDGSYIPEYNKIVIYDEALKEGKSGIEHMIKHELGHHSIPDLKRPFRTTTDKMYRPRDRGENIHKSISRDERSGVTYDDGGESFMRSMKASNLDEAWETYKNDEKLRINMELYNPDSVADLTTGLAKVIHAGNIPAGDRRKKRDRMFSGTESYDV